MHPSPYRIFSPLVVLAGFACACSSTYHPEYHPVTVTNFSQNISSAGGVSSAAQPTVYVVPPPPVVVVPAAAPIEAPPPEFFR